MEIQQKIWIQIFHKRKGNNDLKILKSTDFGVNRWNHSSSLIRNLGVRGQYILQFDRATFHWTISMRGQRATGKIQRNNYHHGSWGPSLTGKTSSVSLIFTHRMHRNVKNRWVKSSLYRGCRSKQGNLSFSHIVAHLPTNSVMAVMAVLYSFETVLVKGHMSCSIPSFIHSRYTVV